ncbi:MAG: CDP-archaeol synthase [Candidatus Babeliaceae bacterium]
MNEFFKRIVTAIFLALGFGVIYSQLPVWVLSCCLGLILLYILVFEWPRLADKSPVLWLLTPLYPILPFVLCILLNQSNQRVLLIVLLLIICSHDAGAYVAGKLWGKHKIIPRVSPGKTWEGFIGGYAISLLVTFVLLNSFALTVRLPVLFIIVLSMNCAALAGDLWESYLKRRVGLKDSGNILPGHGGLLDRFDSIMFGVVVIFLVRFMFF